MFPSFIFFSLYTGLEYYVFFCSKLTYRIQMINFLWCIQLFWFPPSKKKLKRSLMLLPSVPVKIALLGKRHWYYWMMPRGTWHPWSLGIKMLRSGWANNVWSAFKKKTSYKQKVLSMKMGGGHYSPECQGIYFLPLAFRTSNSLAQILKQHRARLDNWILNRILIWMCTTSCKN